MAPPKKRRARKREEKEKASGGDHTVKNGRNGGAAAAAPHDDSMVLKKKSTSRSVRFFGKDASNRATGPSLNSAGQPYSIQQIELDDIDVDVADPNINEAPVFIADAPHMLLQFTDVIYDVPEPSVQSSWSQRARGVCCRSTDASGAMKRILHGISGKVAPGEFMSLMGPTGSGKSTLLNVLAGRVSKGVSGEIFANGDARDHNFKRRCAYVMQDEVLFSKLTVLQTLRFTADLRMPSSMSREEKYAKVDEVIGMLNLGKARHTIIGSPTERGISGGEKKRVAIANELLTSPSILLLDEPTSGLDTSTAINLVRLLKELAAMGLTVVAAIHQPNSQMFAMFDKLLLLVDGHAIFNGEASDAVPYFASMGLKCSRFYNPADFMMAILLREQLRQGGGIKRGDGDEEAGIVEFDRIRRQLVEAHRERFEDTDGNALTTSELAILSEHRQRSQRRTKAEVRRRFEYSFLYQVRVLSRRSFFQSRRTQLTRLPWINVGLIALIVSALWFQTPETEHFLVDRLGALFFIAVFGAGFFAVFTALVSFPAERGVIERERASGSYRLSAYFVGKTLADLPFELLFNFFFATVTYWCVGLRMTFEHYVVYMITMCTATWASSGLGTMISAKWMSFQEALVAGPVITLFCMLSAGFYIQTDAMPVWLRWLQYVSYMKYMYDGLLINELHSARYMSDVDMSAFAVNDGYISGDDVLAKRDIFFRFDGAIYVYWAVLIGWALLFRALAFFFLRRNFGKKK